MANTAAAAIVIPGSRDICDPPADSPGPISLSAQASAASATARIAAPATSNRRGSGRSAGAKAASSPTAISASGGLIAKTHCHPNDSVSHPPRTGPPAVVSADAEAHTPIARLRSRSG